MSFSFIPDKVFKKATDITADWLISRGISLLICDLDHTLAPHSQPLPRVEDLRWLAGLRREGIDVFVVSNNRSDRVKEYCARFGVEYINKAWKPRRASLLRAMRQAGATPEQTAVVGDQILTDVLGANRCRMISIIVDPLGIKESPFCALRYFFEQPFRNAGKKRSDKSL